MYVSNRKILLLLALAALPACTRKVENKPLVDAVVTIGPSAKDTVLKLTGPSAGDARKQLMLQGSMSSADYFRAAELLQDIAAADNNANLAKYAKGMVSSFYENPANFTKSSFAQSLYLHAMVGEAEPIVQEQLNTISRQLSDGKIKLTKLLEKSATEYPWPSEANTLPELVSTTDRYVNWLLTQVPKLGLAPELARPAAAAIREEYSSFRPRALKAARKFQESPDIRSAVANLRELLEAFKISSDEKQEKDLAKALELATQIENTKTSGQALNLLIVLWRSVPPENREATFKPVSPEIYEFFNGKSEASLDCLMAAVCPNPVLLVAQAVVMGKLEEYGIEKLKTQIHDAVRDEIKKSAKDAALVALPTLPIIVRDEMNKELGKYLALIDTVKKDTLGFARRNAENWSKTELNQQIPGVEAGAVTVTQANGRYKVESEKPVAGMVTTGAETLGMSLTIAHKFLPSDRTKLRATMVGAVSKLLAMGGFRNPGGNSYASYAIAMDGPRTKFHNLKTVLGDQSSFAVPDSFSVNAALNMDRAKAAANSSVAAQAELLRGISAQIKFLRDWEPNEFDQHLSNVQVEDLAAEIPKGSINESLFPKRLLFALAVGNSAIQLQNIIKNLSPAFLILPEGEFLWGNQYQEISEGKVSAVAGLVNIENGKRGTIVKTADVARYILALDAFLEATEGVENTKAEPLLEKGEGGSSVIDQLIDARKYLRLFMMGLTNYLVYQAQDKDGGFHSFHILKPGKGVERAPGVRNLQDQALAIRALATSAKRLQMGVYSWSALDAYYFLNRAFFDQKQQFYAAKISQKGERLGAANLLEIAGTIRAIRELQQFMPAGSAAQWRQIERPWTRAMDSL